MRWKNGLVKKEVFDLPVVEFTPIDWGGRLYLVETWQTHWDDGSEASKKTYARVREEETGDILSTFMHGYGFSSAFVWNGCCYVFGSKAGRDATGTETSNHVYMTKSMDLRSWTEPRLIVEQDSRELLYNQSVCHDGQRFVMAYESNQYVPFTTKFAVSADLEAWQKVDGALYGKDKYAACPALRWVNGYYYMLYLERPTPQWWFETWLTRSKDLMDWEDAPHNPVVAPDPAQPVHPLCPEHAAERNCSAGGKEINASDPDLIEWRGKTRVYFTGGCQHWGGYLQYAEFDGPMADFFASYYE